MGLTMPYSGSLLRYSDWEAVKIADAVCSLACTEVGRTNFNFELSGRAIPHSVCLGIVAILLITLLPTVTLSQE